MKKVVYISWMPLSEKVERDWYICHLQERGLNVQYWDVSELFFERSFLGPGLRRPYVIVIESYHELAKMLAGKDMTQTNFVMLFSFEARFYRLFRMLTKFSCKLYFFEWGNLPIKSRRTASNFINRMASPSKLLAMISRRIVTAAASNLKLVKPFDVVFAAGDASLAMHPKSPRHVPVNLCDYDNFLQSKGGPQTLVSGRYCVFLDINLSFHSDLKVLGWEYISAKRYAESLNRFFRLIEERYKLNVVIAAHPKSQYEQDFFEGRTSLKGVTEYLVKDAEFVLSHHSTSISYAVLNKKPLLFIYTDAMAKAYGDTIVGWMEDFAEYLSAPLFNVDAIESGDAVTIPKPDLERYELYKYTYLTSKQSEHTLTRDVLFEEISV